MEESFKNKLENNRFGNSIISERENLVFTCLGVWNKVLSKTTIFYLFHNFILQRIVFPFMKPNQIIFCNTCYIVVLLEFIQYVFCFYQIQSPKFRYKVIICHCLFLWPIITHINLFTDLGNEPQKFGAWFNNFKFSYLTFIQKFNFSSNTGFNNQSFAALRLYIYIYIWLQLDKRLDQIG